MNEEPQIETESAPEVKASPIRAIFINLQVVVGIALLVATLFTAWTPGETNRLGDWEIAEISSIPTPLPTSLPTSQPSIHAKIGVV